MKKYPKINDYLQSTEKLQKLDGIKSFWKVVKVDFCGNEKDLNDDHHGTLVCKLMAHEGKDFYLEIGDVEHYALINWNEYFTIVEN